MLPGGGSFQNLKTTRPLRFLGFFLVALVVLFVVVNSPFLFSVPSAFFSPPNKLRAEQVVEHRVFSSSIANLTALHGQKIVGRETSTVPSFTFFCVPPEEDTDTCKEVAQIGANERGIITLFRRFASDLCARNMRALDIGGNFGFHGVYLAVLGCKVTAFEPVPLFRAFYQANIDTNSHRMPGAVTVVPHVVARKAGTYTMRVPKKGQLLGAAGIGGLSIAVEASDELSVSAVTIDDGGFLDGQIAMMKIDVEGYELDAWASARRSLDKHKVWNVMMEFSPGMVDRRKDGTTRQDLLVMLRDMLSRGYKLFEVPWGPAKSPTWDASVASDFSSLPRVLLDDLDGFLSRAGFNTNVFATLRETS